MHIPLKFLQQSLVLACAFLLCSCAGQAPPSGGPVDTDPPRIISVYPAPLTLNFRDSRIIFEFDEYVDHRSFEGSVFISPSVGQLEFDWSGTEVEISFGDSLRSRTTYVINVGTDVTDIRNKNRMADAFTLAFSTGETIDPGAIMGKVYPNQFTDQRSGVTIFAYKLDMIDPDTVSPSKLKPDYVTQTGNNGDYLLRHLSFGSYRLFAIRDEYKNLLYDPETDEFAVATKEIHLTPDDTLKTDVTLKLAREDTTAPRLVKVTPLSRTLLLAEFSEPLDTSSFTIGHIQVSDTLGISKADILSVAPRLPQRTEFYVATAEQDSGSFLSLRVRDVLDLSKNVISTSASSLQFVSSEKSDTSRPAVAAFSVRDSARNIEIEPSIEVRLTKPVNRSNWVQMVEMRDSLDRVVPLAGEWVNDAAVRVRPLGELWGKAWYTVFMHTGPLLDWDGMGGKDTTIAVHFQTLDADRLSSLEGWVRDTNAEDTLGAVVVSAWVTGQKDPKPISATVEGPGRFRLRHLPEGNYIMEAYRDRNRNGRFDAGNVFPFILSERFSIGSDTLKLRARWPLENVQVRLK